MFHFKRTVLNVSVHGGLEITIFSFLSQTLPQPQPQPHTPSGLQRELWKVSERRRATKAVKVWAAEVLSCSCSGQCVLSVTGLFFLWLWLVLFCPFFLQREPSPCWIPALPQNQSVKKKRRERSWVNIYSCANNNQCRCVPLRVFKGQNGDRNPLIHTRISRVAEFTPNWARLANKGKGKQGESVSRMCLK